jgi:hypothetical protein
MYIDLVVFRCQNEAESKMWEIIESLIDLVSNKLVSFSNTGVIISSIKCLQVVILLFSIKKDATKVIEQATVMINTHYYSQQG